MPESDSSSWMSSSRHESPLISYSLSPDRYMRRVIDTSVYSIGRAPSWLSIVRVTSARPSGARPAVPAKMTSSILPPRSALAPCSPRTHAIASTTFDLPEPLGPTTQVIPGSSFSVVAEAKDLKPFTVRLLRCTFLRGSMGSVHRQGTPQQTDARRTPRSGDRRAQLLIKRARGAERHRKPVPPPGSGQRRLGKPEQLVGLGRSQPIVLGAQPTDLELQAAYLGTQLGDLVEQAPVGRATYVAEEGLRHIFSLICAAGWPANARPGGRLPVQKHTEQGRARLATSL